MRQLKLHTIREKCQDNSLSFRTSDAQAMNDWSGVKVWR